MLPNRAVVRNNLGSKQSIHCVAFFATCGHCCIESQKVKRRPGSAYSILLFYDALQAAYTLIVFEGPEEDLQEYTKLQCLNVDALPMQLIHFRKIMINQHGLVSSECFMSFITAKVTVPFVSAHANREA